MKYVELKSGSKPLFLTEQEVEKPKLFKPTPESLNHIILTDVSGSMYGLLKGLANDLATHIRKLPTGDTVSFGWFSGEGQFRFVLKGYKLTNPKDYDVLEGTIRKELYTRGTTCFSEILTDTKQVIDDLSALNPAFALTFFTDGYPVVSNYEKEVKTIHKAISDLQGKVSSALLVGYGDYYNKELMSTMAQNFGGSLIHSGDLTSFSTSFNDFLTDSRENGIKVNVKLESDIREGDKVFSINGKQVVLYNPQANGEVSFVPTKKAKDTIYALTSVEPKNGTKLEFTDTNTNGKSNHESLVKATYAAAYLYTQCTKTDVALEVLSVLGDKDLIQSVNNSFTHAEYGASESKIAAAMASPSKRFAKGRDTNFLPPANAFCLLDVLNILMEDEKAFFYPQDDRFDYNRIGRSVSTVEGYPKFKPNPSAKCALNSLVWNDKKLNLSVKAMIDGSVTLNGDPKKLGLSEEYPTYVFRNYSLVKDGFLNVQKLPVSVSEETFKKLAAHDLISGIPSSGVYTEDSVLELDLTKVPVINRSIAEGKTSATALCVKAFEEITLEGQLKSLRWLQTQLATPKSYDKMAFTTGQEELLESNGITKNGYNPPVVKDEVSDFYMAKEFEIKIKGFSALPSVNDVLKKFDGEKLTGSLTPVQSLVAKGLLDFWGTGLNKMDTKVQSSWVESRVKTLTEELKTVRKSIQETKFAILLGKKWFDEFTSREENTLTVGGNTFTVSLREVKVNI